MYGQPAENASLQFEQKNRADRLISDREIERGRASERPKRQDSISVDCTNKGAFLHVQYLDVFNSLLND